MKTLSPGTLILGIFAVLFALVGAYAVKEQLRSKVTTPTVTQKPKNNTIAIPLAAADLPAGRKISNGDLMVVRVAPKDLKKWKLPDAFMTNTAQLIGRTLCKPIGKRRAFEPAALYPEGIGPNITEKLKPGQRAVTIPFEGSIAETGLITPGVMVDVLFRTTEDEDANVPEATVTLLEKIEVLAVGTETFKGAKTRSLDNSDEQTVTLAVSPGQAGVLNVVEDRGTVTLVLRGPQDYRKGEVPGPTTLLDVLGVKQPEEPFSTEIYRRGQLTTVTFEDGVRRATVTGPPPAIVNGSAPTAKSPFVSASHKTDSSSKPCCGGEKSVLVRKDRAPNQRNVGANGL